MEDPCKYTGKQVLLVEGKTDCHVILALCKHNNIPENFGIYQCGGDREVLKRLNALILQPDPPERIGVVLDADYSDSGSRWRQVREKIKNHGFSMPKQPAPKGTIIKGGEDIPVVGIWLMPDNRKGGLLEDFLMPMVPAKAVEAAAACVEKAESAGVTTFKPPHRSKAVIHTYLAWQDEPGRPPGQSITSLALRPDTEPAATFVNWLKRLFPR
jgi:hypothetical protein